MAIYSEDLIRHCFFSEKALEYERDQRFQPKSHGHGTVLLLPDGKFATSHFDSKEDGEEFYKWPDKVYQGAFDFEDLKFKRIEEVL